MAFFNFKLQKSWLILVGKLYPDIQYFHPKCNMMLKVELSLWLSCISDIVPETSEVFFVLGRSWILCALCKAVILHSDVGIRKKKKKGPQTHLHHKALLMELYWLLKITIIVTMPFYYCLISGTDFGVIQVVGLIPELQ